MIKVHSKNYRGNFLNLIKLIYETPTANIIVGEERLNAFCQRLEARQGLCLLLPFLVNRKQKKPKAVQIENENAELSVDNMILYAENPKESTQKLLEQVNKYSKGVEHKTCIQRATVFLLCSLSRKIRNENEKAIPALKIKHSGYEHCGSPRGPGLIPISHMVAQNRWVTLVPEDPISSSGLTSTPKDSSLNYVL